MPAEESAGAAPVFRGIWPMLYAFFDEAGRLDRHAMGRQVEACVSAGVHGVAILGLATEVGKLTAQERQDVLLWAAADLGGRLPLAVTVTGATVEEQCAFVRAAAAAGAEWAILQPPRRDIAEADLVRFFGAVADASDLPVGIQNAPEYIGVGLSTPALLALARAHPNVRLVKWEGPAHRARALIEAIGGGLAVVNGRGGLELPDNLRAGCSGLIPGIDLADLQARMFDLAATGWTEDEAEMERLYAGILPLLVFLMQSLETLLCYGKRLAARRLGLGPVHDRAPALAPTAFGLAALDRYAAALPPWPDPAG